MTDTTRRVLRLCFDVETDAVGAYELTRALRTDERARVWLRHRLAEALEQASADLGRDLRFTVNGGAISEE